MRRTYVYETDEGTAECRLENLWRAVRRWAHRHGHAYESSYGVVGVAPT